MTSNGAQQYNIAAIRQLLLAAFTPEELRRFCYDRLTFRPVVDRFGSGQGHDDMADELITYCDTRLLFPNLLTEVRQLNPAQYARFEPDLLITEPKKPPAEIPAPPTPDKAPVTSGPVKAVVKPRRDEPTEGGGRTEEEESGISNGKLGTVANIAKIVAVVVAVLAIGASLFVPEVRQWLGLEERVTDTPVPPIVTLSRPMPTFTVDILPVRSSRNMTSAVEVQGLREGWVAYLSPSVVEVLLAGPDTVLSELISDDIWAFVELFNFSLGVHQVEPVVLAPEEVTVVSVIPETIEVAVALPPTPTRVEVGASAGVTWTRPADSAVMVYVAAGEFLMGATDTASVAADYEKPQHSVYLDAFWIDKHEVSNAQYRICVEAGFCRAPTTCDGGKPTFDDPAKADHPVVCVSWDDAQAYAAWVGGRLPTEAEWEKAARGTSGARYPWGDDLPECARANYEDCVGSTNSADSLLTGASPYGALNMAGNVGEWVADWYDKEYYRDSPAANPQGPGSGSKRVARGGSWYHPKLALRCAFRSSFSPGRRVAYLGFRVVMGADSSPPD